MKAVIAESFERIHRSNLVGMGVMPLRFPHGVNAESLCLTGTELVSVKYKELAPGMDVETQIKFPDGRIETFFCRCMIETSPEIAYFSSGGILPFVLDNMAS